MSDDIMVRLRMAGEQFARDSKELFATVPAEAEKAGLAAGNSLAKGIKGGATAIAAATSEATQGVTSYERAVSRTAPIIDRFAAEQAAATAQVNAARAAYKASEISLEQYNAEVLKSKVVTASARAEYDAAVRELNEVARATALLNQQQRGSVAMSGQQKAGMQQLSFQISDVGAQVASMGLTFENLTRTVAVQSSQFVQAIALMRGSAGGFVGFLAGPWGAAGIAAASILATLGAQALEAGDDMKQAAKDADLLADALERIKGIDFGGAEIGTILSNADKLGRQAADIERRALAAGGAAGFQGYKLKEAEELRRQRDDLLRQAREAMDPNNPARRIATANQARMDARPDRPDRSSRGLSQAEKDAREAERERERAIEAAKRAEEAFEDSIQQTLLAQNDSLRVEQMRAEQGDIAAAGEEARLAYLRQQPLAVHQTVEELAKALGLTEQLTDLDKQRLANLIASADAAEAGVTRAAEDVERRKQQEEADRELKRQIEDAQRQWEDAVRDVADVYEDLFSGNTDRVWKNFRQEGLRIVAEIAAQWTLAMISGQSRGDIGQLAGAALSRSPLGSIFGAGSVYSRTAANDNQVVAGSGAVAGVFKQGGGTYAPKTTGAGGDEIVVTGQATSMLDQAGIAIAAASLVDAIGLGGNSTGGKIGGMLGSAVGMAIGGPVGAAIGSALGAIQGNLIQKLIVGTPKGGVNIGSANGSLGVTGSFGKAKLSSQASPAADSAIDTINEIAEALGATVNASRGRASIGIRKDKYVLDPTGAGRTKGSGVINFGSDGEAAVRALTLDLIKDGVISGISAASQRILQSGQDLEAAIEKAVLIESVPKLLKERLDPLGAELEKIDAKFRDLAAALKEGGASAEQVAQARKLWQLEREDATKQIGEASADLKAFLQSLMAGGDSPLSLRQQKAEAEKALEPYVTAIDQARAASAEVDRLKANGGSASQIKAAEDAARAAAAGIDQQGFQDAAQLLLGISRAMDASGAGFFADFDRIRSLTGGAIGAIDTATTKSAGTDPFAELVAKNTGTTNALLEQNNQLLKAINDNLAGAGNSTVLNTWMNQRRQFA